MYFKYSNTAVLYLNTKYVADCLKCTPCSLCQIFCKFDFIRRILTLTLEFRNQR